MLVNCPKCGKNLIECGAISWERVWMGYYINIKEDGNHEYDGETEIGDSVDDEVEIRCNGCGQVIAESEEEFEKILKGE